MLSSPSARMTYMNKNATDFLTTLSRIGTVTTSSIPAYLAKFRREGYVQLDKAWVEYWNYKRQYSWVLTAKGRGFLDETVVPS